MTSTRYLLLAVLIAMLSPTVTTADLIGDEIDAGIFRQDNTRITGFGLDNPFIVQAGPGDIQQYSGVFTLDVEANGFELDYLPGSAGTWVAGISFQIFDLDWVNMPNGRITGLVIDTNVAGWDNSRATFDDHSATFVFGDLETTENDFLHVDFVTAQIPEPSGATFISICLVAAFIRRKK